MQECQDVVIKLSDKTLDQRLGKRKRAWPSIPRMKSTRTHKPCVHFYDNIVGKSSTVKPKKPVGRPRILTPLEVKQRKLQKEQERSKRKVFIGTGFERWKRLREYLKYKSDKPINNVIVAKVLLDKWFADHGQELENWEKEREKSSSDVTKSSTSLQSLNVSCKMKKTQKEDCGQEEIHGNQDEENITDNFPVKGSESVTEDEEDITDNFPVEASESVTEDEEHITDNFPVKVSESVTEDEEHNTDNFPVQDSEPTAVSKLVVKAPVNSSAESQNKSNTQQSCSQSSLVYVSREAAVVSAEAVVNQTEPPQERTQPDVAKVKDEILDDQSNTDEHSGQQKDNVLVSQNPLNSITETTVSQPQVFPSYVSLLTGNTETKISGSNNKFFIIQNQPSLQTVGGHVPLMVKNVKTFIPLNNVNVSNARTVNVAGKPVAIGNVQNKPVILGGSVQNNPVILSGGVHNNPVILGGGVQTNPVILGTGNRPSVLPQQQFLLLPTQPPQQRLLLTTQNISQKTEINDKISSSAAVQPSVMLVNDSRHNILTPVQPTVNVGYGNRDNNATQFVIKPHVGELNKNDDITPNPVNEIAIKKEPVDTGYPHETAKTLPCDESSSISENVTDSAEQGISEIKLEETTQDSQEENREDITLNMLCTDEGGTECSQNVTQNKVIYTRCRVLSDQDSVDGTAADLAQTKSGETRKNHEVKDDCDDDEDDGSDKLKNNDKGAFYFNYEQVAEDNRRHSSRLKGRRYLSYKRYFGADDADISDDSKKETDKSKDDGTRTESACSNEQTNEISRDSTTNQTPAVAYDNRKAKKRKKKLQNINQLDSDSDMEEETMLEEGIKTEKDEELISEDEVEIGEYEETEEEDLPENPLKKPKPIIVQTSGVPDKKIDLNDPEHRNKYKVFGTLNASSVELDQHRQDEMWLKQEVPDVPSPEPLSFEPSSKPKPKRFKSITQDDINRLFDARQTPSTKRNTVWGMKIFQDWNEEKTGSKMNMVDVDVATLAETLARFYCEAKPKNSDSEMYQNSTLNNIRAAINRHLADIRRNIDITRDKDFKIANGVLDGLLKERDRLGISKPIKHNEIIEKSDLVKISLYLKGAPRSPIILRHCVWYNISINFVARNLEFHCQLTTNSFEFHSDDSGEYVTLKPQAQQSHFQGGLLFRKRMYATGTEDCPVRMLQLLIEKTDKSATSLFNKCKKDTLFNPEKESIWFSMKPLARRTFAQFMTDICQASNVNNNYTPHSLRITAIQFLNDQGYEPRDIMFMSNYKSETSLKSYCNRMVSNTQKKALSMALTSLTHPHLELTVVPTMLPCATSTNTLDLTRRDSTANDSSCDSLSFQSTSTPRALQMPLNHTVY